jgi:type II secretory pathway pseudopilin PulG
MRHEHGYAMAALLVGMAVMAITMTVLMPVWKQQSTREKEAELVFRGQQYARALALYERRHGPGTTPPNVDALVEERHLRKKFKDPITQDDFQVLLQSAQQPGQTGQPGQGGQTPGRGGQPQQPQSPGSIFSQPGRGGSTGIGGQGTVGFGGVVGVASKSTSTSIKIYNGHTHYNEWVFTKAQLQPPGGANAPGGIPGVGGGPGRGGPGQPGGPGGPGGIGGVGGRPGGPGGRPGGPGGFGNPGGNGPGRITIGPDGIPRGADGQPILGPNGQPIQVPPNRGRGRE